MMNVRRRRLKEKSGNSINLILPRNSKVAARFNVANRNTNLYNTTYAFIINAQREDLKFNPDIYGVDTKNRDSTPPSILIPVLGEN